MSTWDSALFNFKTLGYAAGNRNCREGPEEPDDCDVGTEPYVLVAEATAEAGDDDDDAEAAAWPALLVRLT